MQRLIQTTIASDHTESALSAIFVPNSTNGQEMPVQNLREIGLQNIIELPLTGAYINEQWIVNSFFGGNYEDTDTELISSLLNEDVIVIERSPPTLTSLYSFLQKATGVAIGAYVGVTTATALGSPLLMFRYSALWNARHWHCVRCRECA